MPANANDDGAFGESATDQDFDGQAVTREQIRDVYFAGTSDGIVILDKGKTLDLKSGDTSSK